MADLTDQGELYAAAYRDHPPMGRAYADKPGTGPEGETCGSCRHFRRVGHHDRSYFKCGLVPETRGSGTDIRKRTAACRKWEEPNA